MLGMGIGSMRYVKYTIEIVINKSEHEVGGMRKHQKDNTRNVIVGNG